MALEYPLRWPEGWPRTKYRTRAAFSVTEDTARNGLIRELDRLGARNVSITTNLPLRKDGFVHAAWQGKNPDDPGVAVYFTLNGETRCIPCDKWDRLKDNMRAIEKTVEALRGIERWGASEMMQAAFSGFAALPESASTGTPWWEVLGVEPNASEAQVLIAYRERIKQTHPDRPDGNQEAFLRVQTAYDQYQALQQS